MEGLPRTVETVTVFSYKWWAAIILNPLGCHPHSYVCEGRQADTFENVVCKLSLYFFLAILEYRKLLVSRNKDYLLQELLCNCTGTTVSFLILVMLLMFHTKVKIKCKYNNRAE